MNIKEVANLSGVSVSTVSRVLSDDPRISEKTKQKVLAVVDQLGFTINHTARSLKTNKTSTIGLLVPEMQNDYFMSIAKSIESTLRENGYSLIVTSSNEELESESQRLRLLLDRNVDGIVLIPVSDNSEHLAWYSAYKTPLVVADRLLPHFPATAVLSNNMDGAYQCVTHLIQKGFKRIGFIGGEKNITTAFERYEGYIKALKDLSIPYDPSMVRIGNFHYEDGFKLMKELLSLSEPPDHIFIANYFMHIGVVAYLSKHTAISPQEKIISSFDCLPFTEILGYTYAIVAQNVEEIGRRSANLLLERINCNHTNTAEVIRINTNLLFN